ncbi:MAG: hypothetical protein WCK81_15415, partial [Betaproteobacteria bacterium]
AISNVPAAFRLRRWWLVLLALWAASVWLILQEHLEDIGNQSVQIATEGARNMFRMVVLTRSWNASHGGVYVPVTPRTQPNPYLDIKRRDVTTTDGQQINGYCFRVNADTLALKTLDKHTVTIARKAIAGMRLRTKRGRQVAALGKGVRAGVHQGHIWLFSPHAIAGLIAIPSTLAWGAMSLPFCILGDIGAPNVPDKDLKLVADRAVPQTIMRENTFSSPPIQ